MQDGLKAWLKGTFFFENKIGHTAALALNRKQLINFKSPFGGR